MHYYQFDLIKALKFLYKRDFHDTTQIAVRTRIYVARFRIYISQIL